MSGGKERRPAKRADTPDLTDRFRSGNRLRELERPLRGSAGQVSTELLVVGGLIVAIIIAVMLTFRSELAAAIASLSCKITSATSGQAGSCGGATATAASTTTGSPTRPTGIASGLVVPPSPGAGPAGTGGSASPSGPGGVALRSPSPGSFIETIWGTATEPTGPPGTMKGPLVTLPPPGSVAVGPVQPKSAWSQLAGDGFVEWTDDRSVATTRYGNWYGQGWWGGSENNNKAGPMPPADWLDAVAQKHDFGYEIAEEMGKIYGDAEKFRLMALADEEASRDAARLPDDPRLWVPPPTDPDYARRMRDRMQVGFSEYWNLENRKKSQIPPCEGCPPPTPGPMDLPGLAAEQQRRIDQWNKDFLDRQSRQNRP